jgi:hypothetical protein
MQEFITPIQCNLIELYKKLNKQLSLDWIGFDIDYKESHYSFYPPTTPKEQKILDRHKKAFIKRLLKDTIKKAIDDIADEFEPDWGSVISFDDQYLSKWEELSPEDVAGTSYEVIDKENGMGIRAKALDVDSQYVFAQKKDLTPEMWQEFFENKFKKTFDSEAQHANITPEDSTKIEV